MKRFFLIMAVASIQMNAVAQRIDFNYPGRNVEQVNEPDFEPWAIATTPSDSKTVADANGNPKCSAVGL